MSANTSITIAIILLVLSKTIDFALDLKVFKAKTKAWKRIVFTSLSSLFSLLAIYFFVVFAERKIYQTINSKVVLDIYYQPDFVTHDKILRINNLGLVDVNDIHIYFTNYTFDSSAINSNHFFVRTNLVRYYSMRGQIDDTTIRQRTIKSGDSAKVLLNHFLQMDTSFMNAKLDLQFYAIRISFRNSQNGELFVKYLFTPANTIAPDWLENNITLYHSNATAAGPVDTTGLDKTASFRNFILKNQMGLFGDNPEQIYKN